MYAYAARLLKKLGLSSAYDKKMANTRPNEINSCNFQSSLAYPDVHMLEVIYVSVTNFFLFFRYIRIYTVIL